MMIMGVASACFDPSICSGPTPVEDPSYYYLRVQKNMYDKINVPQGIKYANIVDKVKFKRYCSTKNISTFGIIAVYNQSKYQSINWSSFPDSYIIKSNIGFSRNIFVINNTFLDYKKTKGGPVHKALPRMLEHIAQWGRGDSIESQYNHWKPRIIIEKLMLPIPNDIKIYVLHNKVDMVIIKSHDWKYNIYDADMKRLPYVVQTCPNFDRIIPEVMYLKRNPLKLAEMKRIARQLSKAVDLDLVRVDLFLVNDTFYGGELTLTPCQGKYHIYRKNANSSRSIVPHPTYQDYVNLREKLLSENDNQTSKLIEYWQPGMKLGPVLFTIFHVL